MKIRDKIKTIAPLVLVILTIIFMGWLLKYNQSSRFNLIYEDAKFSLDMTADAIEALREEGFRYDSSPKVFNAMVASDAEYISSKEGVATAIYDLEFNKVYEPKSAKFSAMETDHHEELKSVITGTTQGEYTIKTEDYCLKAYWRAIPAPPDEKCYLLMVVDSSLVSQSYPTTGFIIAVVFMCIVIILSLWDSMYLRLKEKE